MFVTNWNSTTKIQKISEITNFFRHYFLSRTEVVSYEISKKKLHFSYKGNKKAANRKGLAALDRSVSYFLLWVVYMCD